MNQTTKFILDMFKEDKKELTIIILIATFGAILAAVTPYIYGRLFDLAIVPESAVNILLGLIILWLLLSLISTYTSNKTGLMGEVLGTKMALKAEADAYSHFLTLLLMLFLKMYKY